MELLQNKLELELLDPDPALELIPGVDPDPMVDPNPPMHGIGSTVGSVSKLHYFSNTLPILYLFSMEIDSSTGFGSIWRGVGIGIGIEKRPKISPIPNPDSDPAVE